MDIMQSSNVGVGGEDHGYRVELACCESTLLSEIADKRFKQKSIAKTYALAIRSSERDQVDWLKVNKAIIARWSMAGLERILKMAWSGSCFNEVEK